jgi:hypothetical protein
LIEMDIPESLAEQAFRATNGEFAGTRPQALEVVTILARRDVAILGGELWWVLGAAGEASASSSWRSFSILKSILPECSPSAQYGMTAL